MTELSGIGFDDKSLPKKEHHAALLRKHVYADRKKVWNKFLATSDVSDLKIKPVTKTDVQKEDDVDGFIQEAIYQAQNFTETLDKIQRLVDEGKKPKKANAVILTAALKELHESFTKLAAL